MKKKRSRERINNTFVVGKITPLNDLQEDVLSSDNHLVLHGCPGTGKTFLALYKALRLQETYREVKKVVIVRSAVATRDIGHMPGNLAEKISIYEDPYRSICSELYSRDDAYDNLKNKGIIEFMSTSNIRGRTIRDCVVIIDEFSNLSYHELRSVITRMGDVERIIFSGDVAQTDIKNNGVERLLSILEDMEEFPFDIFEFEPEDIVRSGLVKEFITIEYEKSSIK